MMNQQQFSGGQSMMNPQQQQQQNGTSHIVCSRYSCLSDATKDVAATTTIPIDLIYLVCK